MIFKQLDTVFYTIFESAPDGIIVVDAHGTIRLVNVQFKTLFGYQSDEIIGKEVEQLIPISLSDSHRARRNNYNASPKHRNMGSGLPLLARKKDGTEFYVEISLSNMTVGDEFFVSAAIRDVTEKRQLTTRLLDQEQKIKEQNNRLVNFAHVVSHNLKSYGTNIGSLLALFEKATNREERDRIMEHLKSISYSLDETIHYLSEVVAIQTDINQKREKIDLKSFVARTIEVLSGEIGKCNALINNHVAPDLKVEYIPAYMESILLNLLSNGIKYKDALRNPVVNVETYFDNGHLILMVSDNGLGIDLYKHGKRLFTMRATFHGNPDARGLGLFITKNQVEAMGGKIEVESEPGKGTTFKVYLS